MEALKTVTERLKYKRDLSGLDIWWECQKADGQMDPDRVGRGMTASDKQRQLET